MKKLLPTIAVLAALSACGEEPGPIRNGEAFEMFIETLCESAVECGYYESHSTCDDANRTASDELDESALTDTGLLGLCLHELEEHFDCNTYVYPESCFASMDLYQ
jgi:hypothetical protein